jgi:hypothetical protein
MLIPEMTETVTLRKQSGETHKFEAMVQATKIFTEDSDLPVEEGDEVERILPNGRAETYVVEERGFRKGTFPIPDHYQMKVRKGAPTKSKPPQPTTQIYNLTGTHARVNIQSEDSSINISSVTNEQLFTGIATAIREQVTDEGQRTEMLEKLHLLKQADAKTIGEKYREFIATAADHMTLLTPFLPALTALLVGIK